MSKPLDPKVKAANAIARRNEKIFKLRQKNLSLKEIGIEVGLTGPRVYKVLRARYEHTLAGVNRMSFTGPDATPIVKAVAAGA